MLLTIEHDRVLELRMDRPPANAISAELARTLREALEVGATTHEGIVISGAPGMFSAGLDVPDLIDRARSEIEKLWTEFLDLLAALARSPVPIAAALTGHSPAGGAVMALFCDLRVMAEGNYRIGLNEVQVGIALPAALLAPFERLVGSRHAERLGVAGRLIDPGEAAALGLVDELVEMNRVVPRSVELLNELLALPRPAMLATRSTFRRELAAGFADRDALIEGRVEQWFSDSTQAALRALVERLASRRSEERRSR